MMLDIHKGHPKQHENPEAVRGSPAHGPGKIGFAALLSFTIPGFIAVQEKVFPSAKAFVTRQFLILDPDVPFAVADVTNHFLPPDNDPSFT
jgi:hypothetical protein